MMRMNDPKREKGKYEKFAEGVKKGERLATIGTALAATVVAVKKAGPTIIEKARLIVSQALKRL